MNNDTAASLQIAYDEAVHLYGPDSIQALDAERAAHDYFKETNHGKANGKANRTRAVARSIPAAPYQQTTEA